MHHANEIYFKYICVKNCARRLMARMERVPHSVLRVGEDSAVKTFARSTCVCVGVWRGYVCACTYF